MRGNGKLNEAMMIIRSVHRITYIRFGQVLRGKQKHLGVKKMSHNSKVGSPGNAWAFLFWKTNLFIYD